MIAAVEPIDPNLDFAKYYREERGDPDRDSKRLYLWQHALWGRPVDGVEPFELKVVYNRGYGMRLVTAAVEFWLGSDAIIPTWSSPGWRSRFAPDLADEVAAVRAGTDTDDFFRIASTIGGYLVFPRNRTGQTSRTINQARGMNPQIADRFDLTLECIRRHYREPDAVNPLGPRLAYYGDFFALFGDFDTYVRFFLLDDLVTAERDGIRSLMTDEPVGGFSEPAYAESVAAYAAYRRRSIEFVMARNDRIKRVLG
jgi:hypothetical protein